MAQRQRRKTQRAEPYDLNLPENWTVNKLKAEISKLGVTLTTQNIPKSALLQIYNQLKEKNVQQRRADQAQESTIIAQDNANQTNVHSDNHVTPVTSMAPDTGLLSSTLNMIASMQGTISTLQTTINNLVSNKQGQNPAVPVNYLEKFYTEEEPQASTSASNMQGNSPPSFGVNPDNLPHVDVISDSMRRNITSGKYVNLASLLIPDFEVTRPVNDSLSMDTLKRTRDHRLDRSLSITQFYKAFGIYKRVMCEAFPQRRNELDLYEADVGNIHEHYGEIFYQYHIQFTKQAAAYLEKGIKVDWSRRHKDLFQLLIGGSQTRLCEHCSQADHQSPFCPTQINVPISNRLETNPGQSLMRGPLRDTLGRSRLTYKGKEICNNFNGEKGCLRPACPFQHACKKCKGVGHGELSCRPRSNNASEQSQPPANNSKSKSSA